MPKRLLSVLMCVALLCIAATDDSPQPSSPAGSSNPPTERAGSTPSSTQPSWATPIVAAQSRSTTQPVTDEEVGQAITRAVDFILAQYDKKNELRPIEGEANEVDHDGLNALCVYALLQASEASGDPRLSINTPFMKSVIDQLKKAKLQSDELQAPETYAHALRAAALAVKNRKEDAGVLKADVDWLLHAHRDGAYTYDNNFLSPKSVISAVGTSPPPTNTGPRIMVAGGASPGPPPGASAKPTPGKSGPVDYTPRQTIGSQFKPMRGVSQPPMQPITARPPHICVSARGNFITRGTAVPVNVPQQPTPPPMTPGGPVYVPPPRTTGDVRETASPTLQLSYPWDNSNSQFGAFGVACGADAGIEIPVKYWQAVEGHWLKDEMTIDGDMTRGRWSYSPFECTPSISMTWAGIASLFVTHDWLTQAQKPGTVSAQPYNQGLTAGMKWLEEADNSTTLSDAATYYVGYNLFTLERIGLSSGYKYFGTHDWYRELSQRVVGVQWPNGAFGKTYEGYDAVVQTAFTILFLSRGRHPIFMEKLRFDGQWANHPRDVANATAFASRELERKLNWEVVPIDHEWTDWLDSPVLFIASHQAPVLKDSDIEKLRSYANSGGLLFTHADAGSAAFTDFVEKTLAPKLYPNYEMQDVPESDPIYSVQYKLNAPLPKLRGINNGSRWLLIHSPLDLGTNWQARSEKPARSSFELAVNLFVYAAGKSDLRNRLASPYIAERSDKPAASIPIARLSYSGNWNPEPYAWTRFDRWMQTNADRKLDITTVSAADLKPGAAKLAVLTGTSNAIPTDAEISAIKSFLESGGTLLIDDCGGTGKFADAVRENWLTKLSSDKPGVIPEDDAILKGLSPKYREGTQQRLGTAYQPMSLKIGAGRVIFSPIDITTGLLGANTSGVLGYQPASALTFAKNFVLETAAR
jgi:hypothetical protein